MPADPDEPGLRDRKKEHTRRLLREGAARLFAERGFAGTTVEDIAAHANVSKRTFFRYFDSKEDLLLPDLTELFGQVEASLAGRPRAEDPFRAACRALLDAAEPFAGSSLTALVHPFEQAGPGSAEGLAAGRLVRAFTEFEDRLSRLVRDRLPTEEPDADLRAAVIAGAALAAVRAVLRTQRARRGSGAVGDATAPLLPRAFDALARLGSPDTDG
ncbi:TetR/AcrR family transcriptional regulator [Streptacidiphilus sp. P02-A3a]|uniref:TetR/AcrR family transcriptional regulator n=1 Tax=Streptacidiphilus sp. P02-A3a TaxID=2704468 RepID=UPI0015FD3BAA|nr:TetR/AcrR family transcriptional regulator [Streptacidiphilus sp. P02-A3a]QMU71162.1 TetR/AcrR family transcriptional regulator [Streptacidiphilus sp. P02-A3a]